MLQLRKGAHFHLTLGLFISLQSLAGFYFFKKKIFEQTSVSVQHCIVKAGSFGICPLESEAEAAAPTAAVDTFQQNIGQGSQTWQC